MKCVAELSRLGLMVVGRGVGEEISEEVGLAMAASG